MSKSSLNHNGSYNSTDTPTRLVPPGSGGFGGTGGSGGTGG
ncbi:hypothetical protein [Flexibacterium corallicola]|nr:hypothetical protein [Pseudovibrio sp. M1P-2-3]